MVSIVTAACSFNCEIDEMQEVSALGTNRDLSVEKLIVALVQIRPSKD